MENRRDAHSSLGALAALGGQFIFVSIHLPCTPQAAVRVLDFCVHPSPEIVCPRQTVLLARVSLDLTARTLRRGAQEVNGTFLAKRAKTVENRKDARSSLGAPAAQFFCLNTLPLYTSGSRQGAGILCPPQLWTCVSTSGTFTCALRP